MISVIIPVYNGEQTIRETINSVLNQTFSDFELIVINDGSQDSTLEIVSSIPDSRIKIFSYPNSGQAISRNRGIERASGEFIAFLDADDLWKPNKLEAQLKALEANPQAAVAYSWTDFIDKDGQFLGTGTRINYSGNVYEKLLVRNFLEHGSNPLIRRQALIEVGGFDGSLTPAEDWDLYLRLACHYQFIAVLSVQVLYRVSANSSSTNVARMEAASLQVIERAFNLAPASLQHLKKYSLSTLYIYLMFKSLENASKRQNSVAAVRYLGLAIRSDLSVLRRRQTLLKALFKIAAMSLLPAAQNRVLITTAKSFFRKFNR
ncbi:MAG TPA: glycosyl transferase family A [Cyanobacteria bacterium UBA11372]|nr:glycosyl transferase family A [Cyanobacteria bacterium UBA11372]